MRLFFAYVTDAENFDVAAHSREDESVFSLSISQNEGEFARASVEVVNSGSGLLRPDRRVFISGEGVGLLFDGRLTGYPRDLTAETLELELLAQPLNWEEEQAAFIETLKVAPFYDPLFVEEGSRSDPAEVLSGYAATLHWPRDGGPLGLSSLTEGARLLEFSPLYESVEVDIGDPPLAAVSYVLEAQWEQVLSGRVDLREKLRNRFDSRKLNTLTPTALEKGWPSTGDIGSGWSVVESSLVAEDGLNETFYPSTFGPLQAPALPDELDPVVKACTKRRVNVVRRWYDFKLTLRGTYKQKRIERVRFELEAALQPVLTNGGATETQTLTLQDVTEPVEPNLPLWSSETEYEVGARVVRAGVIYQARESHRAGWTFDERLWEEQGPNRSIDTRSATFFGTPRGVQAFEHALKRAEARLVFAARALEVSFEVPLENALDLTLNDRARVTDPSLPNGSAQGKVTSYELNFSERTARVTIKCSPGLGGAAYTYTLSEASPKEPIRAISSDLVQVLVKNTGEEQVELASNTQEPLPALENAVTQLSIQAKSLTAEAELEHELNATFSSPFAIFPDINL